MRAIFKDIKYNDGRPYLTEIDSVTQINELYIDNKRVTFPNGLVFYDYNKERHTYDKILILCSEQDCNRILGDLMANGYAELSCMMKQTIIDPDIESISRIKNIIGKIA